MSGLPSLGLLGEEASAEVAAHERRYDALDTKAGVLLGFSGVIVALTAGNLNGALAQIGTAFAGMAAILAGVAFVPRRFPTIALLTLRDKYLTADEEFTRLRLLDTRIYVPPGPRPLEVEGPACHRLGADSRSCCGADRCGIYSVFEEVASVSERIVTKEPVAAANPAPPPVNPDDDLMADLEGSRRAVEAYKREGEALRAGARDG